MKRLRKMMFIFAGSCWLMFGAGFGLLLIQFLLKGAGMQWFGTPDFIFPVSSGSVWIGLVYVVGTVTASLVCLAVSFGLFERAFVPRGPHEEKNDTP